MARSYISFPQLADIVGEADAVALCEHYGGMALYIAKTPERCALNGIISGCGVESICAELGGEEYMLPIGPFRKVSIKERIVAMLESGASHSEVARECRCTTRYVEIVARDIGIPKPKKAVKPKVLTPQAVKPQRQVKKPQILAMLMDNVERLSVREISERFGVSRDYVYEIRREHQVSPYKPHQKGRTAQAGNA